MRNVAIIDRILESTRLMNELLDPDYVQIWMAAIAVQKITAQELNQHRLNLANHRPEQLMIRTAKYLDRVNQGNEVLKTLARHITIILNTQPVFDALQNWYRSKALPGVSVSDYFKDLVSTDQPLIFFKANVFVRERADNVLRSLLEQDLRCYQLAQLETAGIIKSVSKVCAGGDPRVVNFNIGDGTAKNYLELSTLGQNTFNEHLVLLQQEQCKLLRVCVDKSFTHDPRFMGDPHEEQFEKFGIKIRARFYKNECVLTWDPLCRDVKIPFSPKKLFPLLFFHELQLAEWIEDRRAWRLTMNAAKFGADAIRHKSPPTEVELDMADVGEEAVMRKALRKVVPSNDPRLLDRFQKTFERVKKWLSPVIPPSVLDGLVLRDDKAWWSHIDPQTVRVERPFQRQI